MFPIRVCVILVLIIRRYFFNIIILSDHLCFSGSSSTCTFESRSICNYKQDKTDDFDWTWKSGSTTSTGTGPSADHTYGTSKGDHYDEIVICNFC